MIRASVSSSCDARISEQDKGHLQPIEIKARQPIQTDIFFDRILSNVAQMLSCRL